MNENTTTIMCRLARNSGNLNVLGPQGIVQAYIVIILAVTTFDLRLFIYAQLLGTQLGRKTRARCLERDAIRRQSQLKVKNFI